MKGHGAVAARSGARGGAEAHTAALSARKEEEEEEEAEIPGLRA